MFTLKKIGYMALLSLANVIIFDMNDLGFWAVAIIGGGIIMSRKKK